MLIDRIWRVLAAIGSVMIFAAPSQAQEGSFEQASAAFIQRYLEEWAGPAPTALAYMDQLYPDQVNFYGKTLTHKDLMNLKRKFAARWPDRILNVHADSIQALCDPNHLCTVQAIFDWHYKSQERQAASSGSASLQLVLLDGMTILSENGTVIPANVHSPPVPVQRVPAAPEAPVASPDSPAAPATEAGLQQDKPVAQKEDPEPQQTAEAGLQQDKPVAQRQDPDPKRDDIAALRHDYTVHSADKDWMAAWFAQKRDFSSEATFAGVKEDQVSPGSASALRIVSFTSAVGTIACVNPNTTDLLKIGQKVNIHGRITIFIDDVMYLGQCLIETA